MNAGNTSRHVTEEQLVALLDFLRDHQDVAKGLARGRKGSFKSWSQCANILNAYKSGATKTAKAWSKFWCDWKYRVKRRALEASVAKDNTRRLPEGYQPLSPLEKKILDIIGGSMSNIVIKNDPLADGDTDLVEEPSMEMDKNGEAPSRKRAKRRLSDASDTSLHKASVTGSRKKHVDDDTDDEVAHEMLSIERTKLELERRKLDTLSIISIELKRIADFVSDIRGNFSIVAQPRPSQGHSNTER